MQDLLLAYTAIKDEYPANIILVGSGEEKSKLKGIINFGELEDVYMVGFKNQTELPKYYAVADILVLPSELDPSPKTLNEAMNFELPIITTNQVGTAPDLIEETESGLVYNAGDIKQLTEHLKKLISDKKLRKKMGRTAKKTLDNWSIEKDIVGIKKALDHITHAK